MQRFFIEVFNDSGDDWTVECESESDLKKMLQGDILEYTDCDDLYCLINVDIDEIIENVLRIGNYKIRGCDMTPKIIVYRD